MSTNAIVVALAAVISVFAVFTAPAFADDANKAAVLRDLGRNASQSVQAPDASALAAFGGATKAERIGNGDDVLKLAQGERVGTEAHRHYLSHASKQCVGPMSRGSAFSGAELRARRPRCESESLPPG